MITKTSTERHAVIARVGLLLLLTASTSCATLARTENLDAAHLPAEQQANYALFADRCSRCHSLARPLNAGIRAEAEWRNYVRRMRRQPSSGIGPQDEEPIVRFLLWYSSNRTTAGESGGEL